MRKIVAAVALAVVVGGGAWLWLGGGGSGGGAERGGAGVEAGKLPVGAAVGLAGAEAAGSPMGLKDTSMLKPPAGAKVAIFEFDDLECPYCARALPILHAAAERYRIPLLHHDFALTEIHAWSFEAAVTARYLEDKVSQGMADEFRKDVFANQQRIASKDDLARFTRGWFEAHGKTLPFVLDASGNCRNEVLADRALGERIGVRGTPCIFVVTEQGYAQVTDIEQLYRTIDAAIAETHGQVVGDQDKAKKRV
jgi:protein-disulfide isomerase